MNISKKLILALKTKGIRLTLANKEFVDKKGVIHTLITLNNAEWDPDREKYVNRELYSTASPLRLTFYLRDMWYEVNGLELPTDQPQWNAIREKLKNKETN